MITPVLSCLILHITLAVHTLLSKTAIYLNVLCGTNLNSESLTYSLQEENKFSFLGSVILQMAVLFIQRNTSFVKHKQTNIKTFF